MFVACNGRVLFFQQRGDVWYPTLKLLHECMRDRLALSGFYIRLIFSYQIQTFCPMFKSTEGRSSLCSPGPTSCVQVRISSHCHCHYLPLMPKRTGLTSPGGKLEEELEKGSPVVQLAA